MAVCFLCGQRKRTEHDTNCPSEKNRTKTNKTHEKRKPCTVDYGSFSISDLQRLF